MLLLSRRSSAVWLLILAAGIVLGGFLQYGKTLSASGAGEVCVIVDAGHGLPDGGAVGVGGSVEQELNLVIAKKLREVLEGKGIRVCMTRTTEQGLQEGETTTREMKRSDMQKRLEMMKKTGADLFLSIHMNYFPGQSVHGLRVFYAGNRPELKELAEQIQTRMQAVTGAKTAAVSAADSGLFLMKSPPIAAVLVECGFLSNPEEEKKLNEEEYQSRIAWAIADAVEKYYLRS